MRRWHACKNCHEPILWGRWCVDCVRAAGKTIATELIVAALVALFHWVIR